MDGRKAEGKRASSRSLLRFFSIRDDWQEGKKEIDSLIPHSFPPIIFLFCAFGGGIESCLSPLGIPPRSDRRAAPLGRLAQGMNRRSGEGKKSPFFFHGP